MTARNRYSGIIQEIFRAKYRDGRDEVDFVREDIVTFAQELNIEAVSRQVRTDRLRDLAA